MSALARDTGIHKDHLSDAIKRLEFVGLLEVQRGVGLTASHYRMTVPPSLRAVEGEGAKSAPTLGGEGASLAPTVGASLAPTLPEPAPREGAKSAPTVGAKSAPTLHRDYTEGTEEPPLPPRGHIRAEEGNPPSPPASRGEQREPADAGGQTERPRFELPARMRGASLPPGSRMGSRAPAPAPVPTSAPRELPPPETRAEAIRKLAGVMGVRPREARRAIERQEAIEAAPPPPPPLTVDASHLEELRALGWLTEEHEKTLRVV